MEGIRSTEKRLSVLVRGRLPRNAFDIEQGDVNRAVLGLNLREVDTDLGKNPADRPTARGYQANRVAKLLGFEQGVTQGSA